MSGQESFAKIIFAGGSFVRAFTQGLNTSLSVPYLQSTSPGPGASSSDQFHLFPSVARNPNKAIITIDALNSRILTANEMTCELFGFQRDELSGMKIQKLFTEPYSGEQRALMEQNISASGEMVVISGKVVRFILCCVKTTPNGATLVRISFFLFEDGCCDIIWHRVPCLRLDEEDKNRHHFYKNGPIWITAPNSTLPKNHCCDRAC